MVQNPDYKISDKTMYHFQPKYKNAEPFEEQLSLKSTASL